MLSDEIKIEKKKLEDALHRQLANFERHTGTRIESIDIVRSVYKFSEMPLDEKKKYGRVDIKVVI